MSSKKRAYTAEEDWSFIMFKIIEEVVGKLTNLDEVEEVGEGSYETYEEDDVHYHGYYLERCHC